MNFSVKNIFWDKNPLVITFSLIFPIIIFFFWIFFFWSFLHNKEENIKSLIFSSSNNIGYEYKNDKHYFYSINDKDFSYNDFIIWIKNKFKENKINEDFNIIICWENTDSKTIVYKKPQIILMSESLNDKCINNYDIKINILDINYPIFLY